MADMDKAREYMVLRQIEGRGVIDARVLEAMRAVPRHLFVPVEECPYAYCDNPLPIGFGQTISQPYVVGFMLEALNLSGDERVLEIGAGSGYQATLLGLLAKEVWSIERIEPLRERASLLLAELGIENVRILLGDGFSGLPDEAPFEAIMVSAAPLEIPAELLDQLSFGGGILVSPEGPPGCQLLVRITRNGRHFKREPLMDVAFVPMLPGIAGQKR